MTRTVLTLLGGLAVCALAAASFERTVATGMWSGYAFGAAVGLGCALWQRHALRQSPETFMTAVAVGFLVKMFGALIGGVAVRFAPAAEGVLDWQSFLVAYATAAFLSVVAGSSENARLLRGETSL